MLRLTTGILFVLACFASACARETDAGKPVAEVTLSLAPPAAPAGAPLDVRYHIAVAPDAPPFAEDYYVFVHFVDRTGALLWTDDHLPPTPTRQWKPGQTFDYTRTTFVPKVPDVGDARIQVGIYSLTSGRLPLSGRAVGERVYGAGTLTIEPRAGGTQVVFLKGWHDPEAAVETPGVSWQWSREQGILSFRNPKADSTFLLDVDQPVGELSPPQRIEVRAGDTVLDSFELTPGERTLRKTTIEAADLGTDDTTTVTITVDRVFSPARVPGLGSSDTRVLGVRVFNAYIQPNQGSQGLN